MEFLKDASKAFFVGIGGIGMSGLARLLKAKGIAVSGSDSTASSITEELRGDGIPVSIGHAMENLPEDADLVVYSEAIPEENIELQEAKSREIPSLTYFQALGEMLLPYMQEMV